MTFFEANIDFSQLPGSFKRFQMMLVLPAAVKQVVEIRYCFSCVAKYAIIDY